MIARLLFFSLLFAQLSPQLCQAQRLGQRARLPVPAGQAPAEGQITEELLRSHLSVLAADSMEGRETGMPGQKRAAGYIASQLKDLGLRPAFGPGDSGYFQPFSMTSYRLGLDSTFIAKVGGPGMLKPMRLGEDFIPVQPFTLDWRARAEPLVPGFGPGARLAREVITRTLGHASILLLEGAVDSAGRPGALEPAGTMLSRRLRPVAAQWRLAGAQTVFIASPYVPQGTFSQTGERMRARLSRPLLTDEPPEKGGGGVVMLSWRAACALMGEDSATVMRKYYTTARVQPQPGPMRVDYNFPITTFPIHTENVGAVLPGSRHPGQVLALTAHYDHLGVQDGKIYNGADDDGSGSSAVLAMAQAYSLAARAGSRPARSVLFLWFTGEEKGLLGSEYYTTHPAFPLDSTTADLNTDMIGRVDPEHDTLAKKGKDYTYLIGADKISARLDSTVRQANQAVGAMELNLTYNDEAHPERLYYRSDHYNFARYGVPVAFFFTGLHADYHQPTDDIEKIQFGRATRITRLIYRTAWRLSTTPEMLVRKK